MVTKGGGVYGTDTLDKGNSCLGMKEQDKNSSSCYWIIIKHLDIFFLEFLYLIFFGRLQLRTGN